MYIVLLMIMKEKEGKIELLGRIGIMILGNMIVWNIYWLSNIIGEIT